MTTPKEIIDRLANKELSFGCRVVVEAGQEWSEHEMTITFEKDESYGDRLAIGDRDWTYTIKKILGHPVLIGDFLAIIITKHRHDFDEDIVENIINAWGKCGFNKSLQQIAEGSGYEQEECGCAGNTVFCKENGYHKKLKDPHARALFGFLGEMILLAETDASENRSG